MIDTNVLVRMLTRDDLRESPVAEAFFRENEVVVGNQTLCELLWVLRRVYRFSTDELRQALIALYDAQSVTVDEPAFEMGLMFLEGRGDFADGIIAFEGERLGGTIFATFDRKAADIARRLGRPIRLLEGQAGSFSKG